MNSIKIYDLLKLAKNLAKDAGATLLDANLDLRKFHFDPKNIKEVKSLADEVLDRIIFMGLMPTKIPILSEESGLMQDQPEAEFRWIVDPLDGTFNFIKGLGACAISIALWEKKRPIFGVIYDIQGEILYWGGANIGSFSGDDEIQVSNTSNKNEASVCTGFPARLEMKSDRDILVYWEQIKPFSKIRMLGSAAISLVNVAKGCSEAYMEKNIMIWDVAAGLAIVEGAGGVFTHTSGTIPFSLDVSAANKASMLAI